MLKLSLRLADGTGWFCGVSGVHLGCQHIPYPRLLLTDTRLFSLEHLWLDFVTKHCLEVCHFLHKLY